MEQTMSKKRGPTPQSKPLNTELQDYLDAVMQEIPLDKNGRGRIGRVAEEIGVSHDTIYRASSRLPIGPRSYAKLAQWLPVLYNQYAAGKDPSAVYHDLSPEQKVAHLMGRPVTDPAVKLIAKEVVRQLKPTIREAVRELLGDRSQN